MTEKESIESLKKEVKREKQRIDRIVQVLLNNLPDEKLDKYVRFDGHDCLGKYRDEEMTLRSFLSEVLDP